MARETWVQSHVESYQSLKKWYLLNTLHYKVRIKDKVGQFWKRGSAPLHLGVVAIEKEAFGSPSTKVANFTYLNMQRNIIESDIQFWLTFSSKSK